MAIDDVVEKSTITFPRSLDLEETKLLFDYISQIIPADISYNVSYQVRLDHTTRKNKEILLKGWGNLNVSGTIYSKNIATAVDAFKCESPEGLEGDDTKVSLLRFSLTPGWDLNEYRKEVRELWDQTRKAINDYFLND